MSPAGHRSSTCLLSVRYLWMGLMVDVSGLFECEISCGFYSVDLSFPYVRRTLPVIGGVRRL